MRKEGAIFQYLESVTTHPAPPCSSSKHNFPICVFVCVRILVYLLFLWKCYNNLGATLNTSGESQSQGWKEIFAIAIFKVVYALK